MPHDAETSKELIGDKDSVVYPTLQIDTVKGTITIQHKDGSETVTEIPIKDMVIKKPLCNVGVSAQFTRNLGNYESAKVSVALNVPAEYGEIDEVYAFAKDWVDTKMSQAVADLT